MTQILEQAARIGNGQLRVQSFADRRPDRVVWPDTQWQWAALRFENGDFSAADYLDVDAREKWFFQAIGASPAMFRRAAGAGSLYWLGLRDSEPVPGKLFWSLTVYDAETRSQIRTDQNKAALRSMFELADADADTPSTCISVLRPPTGQKADGSRRFPARAGSCTSASTDPRDQPSTAPGNCPTSKLWAKDSESAAAPDAPPWNDHKNDRYLTD
jgi:hypothetical protein